MLALACCYLMWMVTYLAQVHPLERKLTPSPEKPCTNVFHRPSQGSDRGVRKPCGREEYTIWCVHPICSRIFCLTSPKFIRVS